MISLKYIILKYCGGTHQIYFELRAKYLSGTKISMAIEDKCTLHALFGSME